MQLLPSELKCLIVELLSPNSLAVLARTHTSFQREAEKALYKALYIYVYEYYHISLKCIETLATNSEKAGLVRFLIVEYVDYNIQDHHQRMTTYLSKVLINMHSLSDFRVRSSGVEAQSFMGLVKILWSVCKNLNHLKNNGFCWRYSQSHIRLRTLYCHDSDVFNISQIIKSQTGLQILGIYYPHTNHRGNILKTLKEFQNAQISFPIVFSLKRDQTSNPDRITLFFPAFYSVDRRATLPQVLAQSLCIDQGTKFTVAKANNIRGLSIFLIDSSDLPFIYALAKDMAVSFPRIGRVRMYFERRCDIVSFSLTIDEYNRTVRT